MVIISGSLRLQQKLSPGRIGLAYELLVLSVLKRYSFQLVHTGRPGDRGKDFLGHWVLPGNKRVPVVGQCKCYSVPVRPSDVRELEGVLQRRRTLTVGILVSQSGFSINAIETFLSCKLSMILCQIVGNSPGQHLQLESCQTEGKYVLQDCHEHSQNSMSIGSSPQDLQLESCQTEGNFVGNSPQDLPVESKKTTQHIHVPQDLPVESKKTTQHIHVPQDFQVESCQTQKTTQTHDIPIGDSPQYIQESNNQTDTSVHKNDQSSKASLKTPLKLTRGHMDEFIMNRPAQALLPSVSVMWRHQVSTARRREVLLLCRDDKLCYNIGDVRRRDPISGAPIGWSEYMYSGKQ